MCLLSAPRNTSAVGESLDHLGKPIDLGPGVEEGKRRLGTVVAEAGQ